MSKNALTPWSVFDSLILFKSQILSVLSIPPVANSSFDSTVEHEIDSLCPSRYTSTVTLQLICELAIDKNHQMFWLLLFLHAWLFSLQKALPIPEEALRCLSKLERSYPARHSQVLCRLGTQLFQQIRDVLWFVFNKQYNWPRQPVFKKMMQLDRFLDLVLVACLFEVRLSRLGI